MTTVPHQVERKVHTATQSLSDLSPEAISALGELYGGDMKTESSGDDRIIGSLLHRDLYRLNLNITDLCNLLAAQTKMPITVQGVIAWKTRNSIPQNRVAGLLKILGPSSELACYLNGGDSESIFLQNVHYFFGQTDGTYAWPEGSVGDLLKQAKREIEQLRAIPQDR